MIDLKVLNWPMKFKTGSGEVRRRFLRETTFKITHARKHMLFVGGDLYESLCRTGKIEIFACMNGKSS